MPIYRMPWSPFASAVAFRLWAGLFSDNTPPSEKHRHGALAATWQHPAERRDVRPEFRGLGARRGSPVPGPARAGRRRLHVKVLLRNTHALTLHRLEAAGLRLHQVAARWVVGSIEVTKLAALAERDGVERVELP